MFFQRTRLIAAVLLCSSLVGAQGFATDFEKAAQLGDRKAAAELVSQDERAAREYGRALCVALAQGRENQVIDRYLLLGEVYQRVYKSELIKRMGEFYKEGGPEIPGKVREAVGAFRNKIGAWRKAMRDDEEARQEALGHYTPLAESTRKLGAMLVAADCYYVLSQLHLKKEGEKDLEALLAAAKGFVECRQAWDYRLGKQWEQIKPIHDKLRRQKEAGEPLSLGTLGKEEFKGAKLRYVKGSTWERVDGVYKAWTRWDYGVNQMTSSRPILWRARGINGMTEGGGRQGVVELPGFEPKISLMRTKFSRYALDTNGDTRPDAPVQLGGKPSLTEAPYLVDGKATKVGFFFWIGGNREDLSGIGRNLAPNRSSAVLYYRGATGVEFGYKGEKIWFIDENTNGQFGDILNLSSARYAPYGLGFFDSMVLPKQRLPIPCSNFIHLKDGFYKVKISGMTLKLRKLDMEKTPLGTLRMEYKGPRNCRPDHLVMAEVTAFSGALFDIATKPKGVQVPAGKYRISSGFLTIGRGRRAKTASIAAGKAATMDVLPGEETVIEVGGPYTFDFKYSLGEALTVEGMSVKIMGRGGEVYLDVWGGVPEPSVLVRSRGGKRSRPVGQLERPEDPKTFNSYLQSMRSRDKRINLVDVVFTPMDLRVPRPQGSIEVKLVERKHPLFGTIESEWK